MTSLADCLADLGHIHPSPIERTDHYQRLRPKSTHDLDVTPPGRPLAPYQSTQAILRTTVRPIEEFPTPRIPQIYPAVAPKVLREGSEVF